MSDDLRPYRPCVGVMLINPSGEVFVGNRIDTPGDHWQMPQGGIDEGEDPLQAAFRELEEETGVQSQKVTLLRVSEEWLHYDLPQDVSRRIWKGRFRGQKQKWVAFRFLGDDADIVLDNHKPEFDAWRWVPMASLPDLAVSFKRDIYTEIVQDFADLSTFQDG